MVGKYCRRTVPGASPHFGRSYSPTQEIDKPEILSCEGTKVSAGLAPAQRERGICWIGRVALRDLGSVPGVVFLFLTKKMAI